MLKFHPLSLLRVLYSIRAIISGEDMHVLHKSEGFRLLIALTPEMNAASIKPTLVLYFICYPNFTSSGRAGSKCA